MLEKFGLPAKIFPEVIMPGTNLGTLQSHVADRTGLGRVKVVAPGSHDTASAVAAVPAVGARANWAFLSSGTWSLMGVELPEAQLSSRVLDLNLTNEGGVDGRYLLLKNIAGLWLIQQCKRAFEKRGGEIDYSSLVRLAETAPALRSFVDPNDQRFLNPPDMPAAIRDFCRETGQPVPESDGALVRCALESLALKYQTVLTALEDVTGSRTEVIHIIGGGSRNDLLNQFTADACARKVLAGPVEATALGNVLTQARASGQFGSMTELRSIVSRSSKLREFDPDLSNARAWQDAKGRFAKLLQLHGVS